MSDTSLLKIFYGPYAANGITKHRIQRLRGLISSLNGLDYEIELIEIEDINRLQIEMCGRTIFQCNIKNLCFNMSVNEDAICKVAVNAVEEAKKRMLNDLNVPKFSCINTFKNETKLKSTQEIFSKDIEILYEIFGK